ncbi:hypothetical protein [Niabella hibiscisoli]|uniref:hypothetical protein n=1 Tax=Niabella hibiscisoli TaxID=1825928 RepID=UPI001F0F6388|nr:hypothetical protein [Niabella hibiscisoli]MCH5719098.1 hypothetical protein [Niabella hibiscisoli]
MEYNAINGSNDQSSFSFVILRPGGLLNGTTINFTDNGWNTNNNGLTSTEGVITWTAGGALSQFTEVYITATGQVTVIAAASTGSVVTTGSFILSQAGDQVLAFQGALATPAFIAGIHMNSETLGGANQPASTAADWDAIALTNGPAGWTMSQNRSARPPGLTNGTNAMMGVLTPGVLNAEFDNGKIACANSTGATLAAVRSNLNNVANWDLKNDAANPYAIPTGCTFQIVVLPVVFGNIEATAKDNILLVNWDTYEERSNDHFEIEASPDGGNFKTIGTVKSQAANGNSDTILQYHFKFAIPQNEVMLGMSVFGLIAILLLSGLRRKRVLAAFAFIAVLVVPAISCSKGSDANPAGKSAIFLRISQVDVDGTERSSKIVKVVQE